MIVSKVNFKLLIDNEHLLHLPLHLVHRSLHAFHLSLQFWDLFKLDLHLTVFVFPFLAFFLGRFDPVVRGCAGLLQCDCAVFQLLYLLLVLAEFGF